MEPDDDWHNWGWNSAVWDGPPYKSEEFFWVVPPWRLHQFRQSPAYLWAVELGLIVDDEWQGPTDRTEIQEECMRRLKARYERYMAQKRQQAGEAERTEE